ncbi:MAG: hypothetical protein GY909_18560 [Oligoflexia bacterium]|nr:hypothetical protein [Oligoflexia bacterium]
MRRIAIGLMALICSQFSFANISGEYLNNKSCKYLGSVDSQTGYRVTNPVFHAKGENEYLLQKVNSKYQLTNVGNDTSVNLVSTEGRVKDFHILNDRVLVGTTRGLFEYDMRGDLKRELFRGKVRAFELDRKKNVAFLIIGNEGLLAYDLLNEEVLFVDELNTQNENGHRSASTGIAQDENNFYIAMTGRSEKGFNGVVVYSKEFKKIISKNEYNKRRAGVIFPYVQMYSIGDSIFLNNGGWIHQIKKSQLVNDKKIMPKWRAISYSQNTFRQFIMLQGDLIFQNNNVLGCGEYFKEGQRSPNSKDFVLSL